MIYMEEGRGIRNVIVSFFKRDYNIAHFVQAIMLSDSLKANLRELHKGYYRDY